MFALVLAFLLIGGRWIWIYRRGQPFDIDEAAFLGIALSNYNELARSGIAAWWQSVMAPSIQAPLTTAIASLLFDVTGPQVVAAFAVPLLAGAGCILATNALGRSLGSRYIGLSAAILVASTPVIINYSRSFHFAVPATLVVTLTLLALLKSNRFERWDWSIAFGVGLGLMPLARTMTIAFVPGVLVGAFLYLIADPARRAPRLFVFAVAVLTAVLTASVWLGPNGQLVYEYLFNFGYGARAAEFGAEHSKWSIDAWVGTLAALCNKDIYLPHLLVAIAGGAATLVVACTDVLRNGPVAFVRRALRSRALPIVVVVVAALAALTSSRNSGSAFFAPIVPAMAVLTAWAFLAISHRTQYRILLWWMLALVATGAAAPLLDLHTPLARPRSVTVPVLGFVTISDGRGTLQAYEAGGGFGSPLVAQPLSVTAGRAWVEANRETAATITRLFGGNAVIAFGFRHVLYNVNTLNVEQAARTGKRFGAHQVEPTVTGDSVQGYVSWLSEISKNTCALLTSERIGNEFAPTVTRALMQAAAEQVGFSPALHWSTPDGQTITLWTPRADLPHCRPT